MPRRAPSLLLVHIVWSTARRRPILSFALEQRLLAILASKARELGCAVFASGCAPDHVHVVARLGHTVSLSELVQRMKGASAYELNHGKRSDRRVEWQQGYWAESLAPGDLGPLIHYVCHQRQRHDASHPAERWAEERSDRPVDGLRNDYRTHPRWLEASTR